MASAYPHYMSSEQTAVTGTTAEFTTGMTEGNTYLLSCSVDCYFIVAGTGTAATEADNSHYLGGNQWRLVSPTDNTLAFVNIIKKTGAADGVATLSLVVT